jgi:two-component system response regulator HydG
MQSLFELVEQIAPFDIPVLITGESGVGKERFAEAIHQLSQRSERSMVVVNCAALSPSLVERELFGHRRGSFTGATRDRRGRFEEANGGTLLLDEIGDLPLELQPKLLRALQEGEVQRVGEDRPRQVDVRVLAATNRRLEDDVAAGRFRQDLYFRLLGARVHIPPLRERREDIPPLCDHLLAGFDADSPKRLSDNATARLLEREWPGNVRELANVLQLATIRAGRRSTIEVDDLVTPGSPPSLPSDGTLDLAELERRTIERALQRTEGNLSAAAKLLGIDRTTLWRRLKR